MALKTRSAAATNSAGLVFFPLLVANAILLEAALTAAASGDLEPIAGDYASTVFALGIVGTGIMLINLEDLQKIEKPWFGTHWVPAMGDWLGEDWFFLQKASLKDIPCYVDHDLSREVGHRGVFTVTHDWVGQVVRQEVEETPEILTP